MSNISFIDYIYVDDCIEINELFINGGNYDELSFLVTYTRFYSPLLF